MSDDGSQGRQERRRFAEQKAVARYFSRPKIRKLEVVGHRLEVCHVVSFGSVSAECTRCGANAESLTPDLWCPGARDLGDDRELERAVADRDLPDHKVPSETPVGALLDLKGRDVYSVEPTATIYEALTLMAELNLGAIVVLDDDELVGIMSERDYARQVILEGRSSRDTPVSEIMTHGVETVTEAASVEDCMVKMTVGRFRHLPVVEGESVIGLVSIGDVVKSVIETQQRLIGDLERYITG